MKKQPLVIGSIIVILLILGGYMWLQQSASDVELIKEAFAEKHDVSTDNMEVGITERIDNYATGSVDLDVTEPPGGSIWYAVKESGSWTIAFGGNGFPLCSEIEPYRFFPIELLESCVDDDTQDLIQR